MKKTLGQTDFDAAGPAFSGAELDALFFSALGRVFSALGSGASIPGPAKSRGPGPVLILPPDLTRIHSGAGLLTGTVCRRLSAGKSWSLGAIMPALGTHRPLGPEEIAAMFPQCPAGKFLPHKWREDTVELGRLEADWVEAAFTGGAGPDGGAEADGAAGAFHSDWPVQVNKILRDGLPGGPGEKGFSLIVSIGQVVPHEIAGMANHTKNVFIGTGGAEAINKSHYLGALYGLERIMGKAETPVRALFDEGFRRYGSLLPPVLWVLTVVDSAGAVRGLFTGFGRDCFEKAAAFSQKLNITRLEKPAGKVVVWLDPAEYRSVWLGNKAVYRTRMAIAAGGELVVIAPGLECFGEDRENDALIRRYGYRGGPAIRQAVEETAVSSTDDSGGAAGGLAGSLSAAAHLIHGSSEGRFTIRYCTSPAAKRAPSGLSREEIEAAGYEWTDADEAGARYIPELKNGGKTPKTGWKTSADGETFYFVANPALGLWRA
ncbi:MAG: D-mannonate epimerase [Treponema sp.]|jgi:nickel-dependent lactate racemase|nr:D-mannonate epimerase [Treponema sp.]